MRAALPAVLLLLATGCAAPDAMDVAREAGQRLDADRGVDGAMASFETEIRAGEGTDTRFVAHATWEALGGDRMHARIAIPEFVVRDKHEPGVETVVVHVYCSPQRMVLMTEGLEPPWGNDTSVETRNDAGGCLDHATDPETKNSTDRLVAALGETYWSRFVRALSLAQAPTREAVEARWEGSEVAATYVLDQTGLTARSQARIRDGRIQQETIFFDGQALPLEVESAYAYGERKPGYEVRGAQSV